MLSKLPLVLLCGGIALKLTLLARMWQFKLVNRYPIVTVCLSFSLLRTAGLLWLTQTGNIRAYRWLFYTTQPALWVLYFLLILEFYSLMLEGFPGIRRLARIAVFSGLGMAAVVCCALTVLEKQSVSTQDLLLAFSTLQDRNVFLCLSALTALFFLLVSYYRLPISRNLWVLSGSFGCYFILSSALSALFGYLGDAFIPARNLANSISYLAAMLCASLLLSRAGETQNHKFPVPWASGNQELELALMAQLQGFNQVLGRVLRS